jgi:hypothetical protein
MAPFHIMTLCNFYEPLSWTIKCWCLIHFFTKVLEIFSCEKHTILGSNVKGFTFELQVWVTMADIILKYQSKFLFTCVIFRSKIKQKVRIFPKGVLWMRHQRPNSECSNNPSLELSSTLYPSSSFSTLSERTNTTTVSLTFSFRYKQPNS